MDKYELEAMRLGSVIVDAREAGRKEGYGEGCQITLSDALEAADDWVGAERGSLGVPIQRFIESRVLAKHRERTQSPEEAENKDPPIIELTTKVIVDNAVEAEHKKTVEEVFDAYMGELQVSGRPTLCETRARTECERRYQARTNPKPDTVTVRMSQALYDAMKNSWDIELLDPAGESETDEVR